MAAKGIKIGKFWPTLLLVDASSYCQKLQSLANIFIADNMGVSSSVFALLSPKARQKKSSQTDHWNADKALHKAEW